MRQPGRARGVIGAFAMVVATTLAVDAAAQQQLRLPRSSVEIDWSVLDELDSRPSATPRLTAPARPARSSRAAPRPAPAQVQAPESPRPPARSATRDTSQRDPVRLQPPRDRPATGAAPAFTPPAEPPAFTDKAPEPRPSAPATASPAAPPPAFSAPPPPPPPAVAAPAPTAPAPAAPPPPAPPAPAVAATPSPPPAAPAPPAPSVAPPPPAAPPPAPRATAPAPAPQPAPPPAPAAPAPTSAAPQVAALPPASDGRLGRVDFGSGAADLPATARETLDKAVAALKQDEGSRLQIVAYATGGDESGSQARRLSLSRALAVRSYLIDQGVRSTRMDVRALGNRSPDGPADRVDIVLVRR